MKQLIILVALVVVGYFAYQHFFRTPQQEAATEEEDASIDSGSFFIDQLPPIPENCEGPAKNLENAIYGSHQVKFPLPSATLPTASFNPVFEMPVFRTPR